MRAIGLLILVLACAACVLHPQALFAQTQGAQTGRGNDDANPVNPLLQGLIGEVLREIERNRDPDQPGGTNGDDVGTSQPADRTGPVIRPAADRFASRQSMARVTARITDPSGIDAAYVIQGNQRYRMAPGANNQFTAEIPLASNYAPVPVAITARDKLRNRAVPVTVSVRRAPWCGRAAGVSVPLVRSVQQNLTRLGHTPGGVDGIAGEKTCRALEEAGITAPFNWPDAARQLEWRIGLSAIGLTVTPPGDVTQDRTRLQVRVLDPRQTGAVAWVAMEVNGAEVGRQLAGTTTLDFAVDTPEGSTQSVLFLALPKDGRRPLARAGVTLERLGPIELILTGAALSGDRIESEEARITLQANVDGTGSARIFRQRDGQPPETPGEFTGSPVRLTVDMPDAGERARLVLWAVDGDRTSPRRAITLYRIPVFVPVIPPLDPSMPGPAAIDASLPASASFELPRITDRPAMPGRVGADNVAVIVTQPHVPAGWSVPPIVWAVLVGLLVSGLALRRVFGSTGVEAPPETPPVAPALRLVAVPDDNPEIGYSGADLPGLVMVVEEDAAPTTEMQFEPDLEEVT